MRKTIGIVSAIAVAVTLGYGAEVLSISYETWGTLQQNGAVLHPDASLVSDPIACLDMGSNGFGDIPSIALPQGAFSIESRFFLRDYNGFDPNISDIFAGFSINYDGDNNSEGIDFRVGGGYNYALKIQDVFHNLTDWNTPTESQKAARASISRAIGELAIGSGKNVNGHGAWKEVFTDRCVEKNKWMHMVATWNGTALRMYLNGHHATDPWRTVGSELPAFIEKNRTITLGAANASKVRHFNGKIGYVKIYDQALESFEIWRKYRESLGSNRCEDFIKIESPRCGELISPETEIKFAIKDSMDNDVTSPELTFKITISKDPGFSGTVHSFPLKATGSTFGGLFTNSSNTLEGLLYFRIATGADSGLRKTTATALAAESGTLPIYLVPSANRVHRPAVASARLPAAFLGRLTNGSVYDLRGRFVNHKAKPANMSLKNGVYIIQSAGGAVRQMMYMP